MTDNGGTQGDRGRGDGSRRNPGRGSGGPAGGRSGYRRDQSGGSRSKGGPGTRSEGGPRKRDGSSARSARQPDRGRQADDRSTNPAVRPTRAGHGSERETDPLLPEGLDLADLPRPMKAELKGLPPEMADKVGLRLVAAGQLLDVDPEAAYAQAKVARRLAARLPIVRAAVAETAYAAGDYHAALTDYRALRRMSGDDAYLPVMADCERALGRPEEALKIAREAAGTDLDPASAIEMRMVEAGARADLGQHAEALRLLEREIQSSQQVRGLSDTSKARLRYAYADQLLARGERGQAREWFLAAAKLDREGQTDADERVAELDGVVIEFDESDEAEDTTTTSDRPGVPAADGPVEQADS